MNSLQILFFSHCENGSFEVLSLQSRHAESQKVVEHLLEFACVAPSWSLAELLFDTPPHHDLHDEVHDGLDHGVHGALPLEPVLLEVFFELAPVDALQEDLKVEKNKFVKAVRLRFYPKTEYNGFPRSIISLCMRPLFSTFFEFL